MDDAPRHRPWTAIVALVLLLGACAGERLAARDGREQARALTLFAFNYTDRAILDITSRRRVDGKRFCLYQWQVGHGTAPAA